MGENTKWLNVASVCRHIARERIPGGSVTVDVAKAWVRNLWRYQCACLHVRKSKMAFTFYSLLEACLLVVNAVAVLHEERFLAKSKLHVYIFVIFQRKVCLMYGDQSVYWLSAYKWIRNTYDRSCWISQGISIFSFNVLSNLRYGNSLVYYLEIRGYLPRKHAVYAIHWVSVRY